MTKEETCAAALFVSEKELDITVSSGNSSTLLVLHIDDGTGKKVLVAKWHTPWRINGNDRAELATIMDGIVEAANMTSSSEAAPHPHITFMCASKAN